MQSTLDQAIGDVFDGTETKEVEKEVKVEAKPEVVEPKGEITKEAAKTEVDQETDKPVAEEAEEKFTKVNPNELSPELQSIYKSLQADYTKKRQIESERVRRLEEELENIKKSTSEVKETPEGEEETPEQVAKRVFRETQEEEFDRTAKMEYPKIDPRLDEGKPVEYDEILDEWVRANLTSQLESYVEENGTNLGFDYKGISKELISKFDTYLTNLKKAYLSKETSRAKEQAGKLQKQSPSISAAPSTKAFKKMNLNDAIESAFDEAA